MWLHILHSNYNFIIVRVSIVHQECTFCTQIITYYSIRVCPCDEEKVACDCVRQLSSRQHHRGQHHHDGRYRDGPRHRHYGRGCRQQHPGDGLSAFGTLQDWCLAAGRNSSVFLKVACEHRVGCPRGGQPSLSTVCLPSSADLGKCRHLRNTCRIAKAQLICISPISVDLTASPPVGLGGL